MTRYAASRGRSPIWMALTRSASRTSQRPCSTGCWIGVSDLCVASKSADQRASYRGGDIAGAKMTHINLLGEYAANRNAEAFARIIAEYQQFVFATCRR